MDHVLFQAHPEIQSHRPILSVIQRSRQIDAVFPHGIIATHVHHTVIIFTHQVQTIQCLCPKAVSLSVETEVGTKSKTMVIVKIQSVKLDDRGMYAKRSPLLESKMLGGGYIETGEVVGIFIRVIKYNFSATCLLMAARVIGT